ncbi:putative serine/arginine repetitive matrix protein 1 isoform X1 [Iris pallida]|uniref:Serine/arginine repetitive matrix protein 1 isoform X1 n=1 Tax=Iris pallida TaxID=29817 RepID=A0AAX6EZP4_IRIPA|nr:putative serine/arginine repetitive matrix protein 1 isoform X1 [Iris pallida]KAJ6832943.1 putative serine/arginine repetitive matrix protein 1 isoform X1 [Iris pallida]
MRLATALGASRPPP